MWGREGRRRQRQDETVPQRVAQDAQTLRLGRLRNGPKPYQRVTKGEVLQDSRELVYHR